MQIDLNKQREALKARLKAQADAAKTKKGRGISPHARDKKVEVKGRLPHRSHYGVDYDAERQLWSGRLVIGASSFCEVMTFTAEASGVFKLLERLDDLYREYLKGGA